MIDAFKEVGSLLSFDKSPKGFCLALPREFSCGSPKGRLALPREVSYGSPKEGLALPREFRTLANERSRIVVVHLLAVYHRICYFCMEIPSSVEVTDRLTRHITTGFGRKRSSTATDRGKNH